MKDDAVGDFLREAETIDRNCFCKAALFSAVR